PAAPLVPYTTLFRSGGVPRGPGEVVGGVGVVGVGHGRLGVGSRRQARGSGCYYRRFTPFPPRTPHDPTHHPLPQRTAARAAGRVRRIDRKSTRLNSSHVKISYAVFCLKKKKKS